MKTLVKTRAAVFDFRLVELFLVAGYPGVPASVAPLAITGSRGAGKVQAADDELPQAQKAITADMANAGLPGIDGT